MTAGPAYVYEFRASPSAEDDLDWFYTRAASELGQRSNFFVMFTGGNAQPGSEVMSDVRIAAMSRQRRVWRRLTRVPYPLQQVLQARFEAREWPKEARQVFGPGVGVAVRTEAAKERFRRDAGKRRARAETVAIWLEGVCARSKSGGRAERALALEVIVLVRAEAEALYRSALHAFEARNAPTSG
jgi:hypothetical protein